MSRRRLALLWAFIVAGIVLRLLYIDRPAYLDESATFIDYTKLPFAQIASTYFDPNNHVFYSLLMRVSYLLFGFDAPALRLPALLAGIAILPLTFAVGRAFYDNEVALLGTGLAAVSAPLIEYSVSGRGYTFIAAALLLLLWLPTRTERWRWFVFAGVSALGFYTLPTMLYPMGIAALYWGLRYVLRREWRELGALAGALAGGAVLTLLLYTPILRAYGFAAVAGNRHIVALPYGDLLPALARLPLDVADYLFIGLPRMLRYGLALMVGIGLVVGSPDAPLRVPTRNYLLGLAAVVWVLAVLVVQRVIPPVRVWVFIAPLVALWLAGGCLWLIRVLQARFGPRPASLPPRRGTSTVTLVASALLPLFIGGLVLRANVNGSYAISSGAHDADAAATYIADELAPDDMVLFVAGWVHPLWYELERRNLPPERALLNAPTSTVNAAVPLYLLAFSQDDYLDNRTREAFGTVYQPGDLTPVVTFPTGEWTLYRVER